jgi:putative DNA primase/helicase
MIQGCLDWQQRGLNPPDAVTAATDAYLETQDALASWIDDDCIQDAQAWDSSKMLWASWKLWAERCGEFIGNRKTFGERLERHGYRQERRGPKRRPWLSRYLSKTAQRTEKSGNPIKSGIQTRPT